MNYMQQEWNHCRDFEAAANRDPDVSYSPYKFGGFEWLEDSAAGMRMPSCTIDELSKRPPCPLRIVFAPLDVPDARYIKDLLELYRHYSIPGAFVSERIQNVACSFGSAHTRCGFTYSWFHFLCKDIPIRMVDGRKFIKDTNRKELWDLSQADNTWVRSGYCLKVKAPSEDKQWSEATLIIFGFESLLFDKFNDVSNILSCGDILQDPFCLFELILDYLYCRIEKSAWDLASVFSQEEEKVLRSAQHPGSAVDAIDFVGLHNLSRHQIYLVEATEALTETLNSIESQHDRITKRLISPAAQETQAGFRHRKTLLKSTGLRLRSLEKRIQNIINLSFNLVTQADSRTMKVESSSMKTIAAMTLVFLPCTAVATIFSTPFFYLEGESEGRLGISPYSWIIWVISAPLTVMVMFVWYWYQKRLTRHRVFATLPTDFHEKV